jgi:hypothetical protein
MAAEPGLVPPHLIRVCLAGGLVLNLCGVDAIYLNDGSEIQGDIISTQGSDVLVDIGMATVSINRHRILSITSGQDRRQKAGSVPPSLPADGSSRSLLRMDAGCAGGWYLGELRGTGVLRKGGLAMDFSEESSLKGLRPSPGAYLRATASPRTADPAPVLGLQVGYEPDLGASGDGSAVTYAAVGGVTWMRGSVRCDLLAIAGWTTAALANRSVITGAGGATLGQADYDIDLAGWHAAIELSSAWSRGPWNLGLGAGLASSRLTGDAEWATSDGTYIANEHFSAYLVGIYASFHAGVSW